MEPTWRDRLRYRFDTFMSRGTVALIAGLFLASAAVILIVSLVVAASGAASDQGLDLPTLLWMSLLRTLDSGTMGGDTGGPLFLGAMLAVTFGGIFVISALIGVINTGIESKLTDLRKGRSRVIERDHVVVLGWSQEGFAILAELVEANRDRSRATIVVLADRDKVELEDEIRGRVTNVGPTRIVVRTGRPMDLDDLEIASIHAARAIVVLAPDSDDPDIETVQTILAITSHPRRRSNPYHVVAEIRDPANLEVARMIGKDEVELVVGGDLIARITAQTCRQAGLSVVYTELLDFAGDEIYFLDATRHIGRTFGDTLLAYDNATVIGLERDGVARVNAPLETPIGAGDRLIVIAEDDDAARLAASAPRVDEAAIVTAAPPLARPERTLILGWNWRAPLIIRELDAYVPHGSRIHLVADEERLDDLASSADAACQHARVTHARADTSDRRVLEGLDVPTYDHVIVLCYSDRLDAQRADARTLLTLLHLREIAARAGRRFTIVSEMLDVRNRALAEVARPDDFIVSDRLVSLLVAQVTENKALNAVFADLFDAEGAEIYLRPIERYVAPGTSTTVATLVEAARRLGELAIGYHHHASADAPGASHGIRINPPKSQELRFGPGDQLIVIADE